MENKKGTIHTLLCEELERTFSGMEDEIKEIEFKNRMLDIKSNALIKKYGKLEELVRYFNSDDDTRTSLTFNGRTIEIPSLNEFKKTLGIESEEQAEQTQYFITESRQKGQDMSFSYMEMRNEVPLCKSIDFNSSQIPEELIKKLTEVENEIIDYLTKN